MNDLDTLAVLEILREIRDAVQDTNHYVRMAWDQEHGVKDVDPEADGDPTDSEKVEPEHDDDFCLCNHTRASHAGEGRCYTLGCSCLRFQLDTGDRTIKSGDKIDRDLSESLISVPPPGTRDIDHLLVTIYELRARNAQLHELLFRASSWLEFMTWATEPKRWVDKFQADYRRLLKK